MSLFSLKREKKGDREILRLEGAITGDAGLEFIKLYDGISPKCTFNFRDVISINSQGLQVWTMFLRDFVNDHEVQLEECPPVIVSQMNMLPSFVQKAKVTSIYVPYFCEACNKMRLTADGKIRPCLGDHSEVDLKPALRPSINKAEVRWTFQQALQIKPLEHSFRNQYQPLRIMTAIGG